MSLADCKRTYLVEQQFLGQRIAWCRYLERADEARKQSHR